MRSKMVLVRTLVMAAMICTAMATICLRMNEKGTTASYASVDEMQDPQFYANCNEKFITNKLNTTEGCKLQDCADLGDDVDPEEVNQCALRAVKDNDVASGWKVYFDCASVITDAVGGNGWFSGDTVYVCSGAQCNNPTKDRKLYETVAKKLGVIKDETTTPLPEESSSTKWIIIGVVGGVVLLIFIATIIYICWLIKRKLPDDEVALKQGAKIQVKEYDYDKDDKSYMPSDAEVMPSQQFARYKAPPPRRSQAPAANQRPIAQTNPVAQANTPNFPYPVAVQRPPTRPPTAPLPQSAGMVPQSAGTGGFPSTGTDGFQSAPLPQSAGTVGAPQSPSTPNAAFNKMYSPLGTPPARLSAPNTGPAFAPQSGPAGQRGTFPSTGGTSPMLQSPNNRFPSAGPQIYTSAR